MRARLAALMLCVPLSGCAALLQTVTEKQAQLVSGLWARQLDTARAQIQAAPGQYAPTASFTYSVIGWAKAGNMPAEQQAALIAEAEGYIRAALQADPAAAWAAHNDLGRLKLVAGDPSGAIADFQASQGSTPNVAALDDWLGAVSATGGQIADTCAHISETATPDMVYDLLNTCRAHGDDLSWADAATIVDYQAEAERRAAAQAARQAELAASAPSYSASTLSSTSSSSSTTTSSAPARASISLKNGCSQTVKLFFGDKPKYGSGRYSTIGANNIISESMSPGDMIWIVDDSQNGVSSFTAGSGSQRVEINSSCTGFIAR